MKIVVEELPLTAERCKFSFPSPLFGTYFCFLKGKDQFCDKDCTKECEELITLDDLLSSRR